MVNDTKLLKRESYKIVIKKTQRERKGVAKERYQYSVRTEWDVFTLLDEKQREEGGGGGGGNHEIHLCTCNRTKFSSNEWEQFTERKKKRSERITTHKQKRKDINI